MLLAFLLAASVADWRTKFERHPKEGARPLLILWPFGPVALVFRVESLEEALRLANDSDYGLGASLWSVDPDEQETFVDEIEAGMAFVNGIVSSDPRLPFGGVKRSGFGRELSLFGLLEFVNVKTVWIKESMNEPPKTGTE